MAKTKVFFVTLFSVFAAVAASVQWNCFGLADMTSFSSGTYMLGYSSSGRICPEINLHVSDAGLNVSMSGSITLEGSIATWMLACAGDILDASYFTDGPIFAYRDLEGRGGTMTAVSKDSAFYLGVKVEELTSDWPEDWDGNWSDTRLYTGKYDYAWVMLDVDADGRLSLRSSALDLDGGPMIVGGGSAIPEPSGGLLFLLGGATLALRRRRRTPIEAAFAVFSEWERMAARDRSRKL